LVVDATSGLSQNRSAISSKPAAPWGRRRDRAAGRRGCSISSLSKADRTGSQGTGLEEPSAETLFDSSRLISAARTAVLARRLLAEGRTGSPQVGPGRPLGPEFSAGGARASGLSLFLRAEPGSCRSRQGASTPFVLRRASRLHWVRAGLPAALLQSWRPPRCGPDGLLLVSAGSACATLWRWSCRQSSLARRALAEEKGGRQQARGVLALRPNCATRRGCWQRRRFHIACEFRRTTQITAGGLFRRVWR